MHLRTTASSRKTCLPDFVQLLLPTTVRERNHDLMFFEHRAVQSDLRDEQE